MAGEVKEKGKGIAYSLPPQEEWIFHNMQYNHHLDSDRRRLSIENIPGVYDMSCMQLLALATNTAGASSSVGSAPFPLYSGAGPRTKMDFPWASNFIMETSPGTFLGVNGGVYVETPMPKQYDVQTPHKFVYDLNLTPEEIMRTSTQPTEPEFTPINLETPAEKGKQLPETVEKPTTGKKKRARNGKAADLKTPKEIPKEIQKRKKIRGKVVREGKKKTVPRSVTKSSSPAKTNVRPKRATKRSLRFEDDSEEDFEVFEVFEDFEEEEDDDDLLETTMRIVGNIPKRRRQSWTNDPTGRNMETNEQAVTNGESLSMLQSMHSLHLPNIPRRRRTDGSDYKQARKRLSKLKQRRKVRSLKRVSERIKHEYRGPSPQLIAELLKMHPNIPKMKRKNANPKASKLNSRLLNLHWLHYFSYVTSVADRGEDYSKDLVNDLFKKLDINSEVPGLPQNEDTPLLLEKRYWQQLEKMMFKPDGTIIPYPNEKNYQTKVDLDKETIRVWKLLMISSHSEGIDGTDEENQKYWKEEREVFHGYANSFIAHMRLVQGDRSFSPWKGSVVDSVIGVFLTQNVTDHSSSSAFMDVAARFPIMKSIEGSSELGSSVTDDTILNSDMRLAVPSARLSNPTFIVEEIEDDDEDTDAGSSITSTNQGISKVSSPPPCLELNLNEVPPEAENFDAFINEVDKGSQAEPICSHQEELRSQVDAQHQEKKKTNSDVKKPKRGRPKKQLEGSSDSDTLEAPKQEKNKTVSDTKKPKSGRGGPKSGKPKSEPKSGKGKPKNQPKASFDWDSLRKKAEIGGKKERSERAMDSADWDALRRANVEEIAALIRQRGNHNVLSERIQEFLKRLVRDHGAIDLEWLRDVPPDQAKEYLLSVMGLGLKSVECVRLLSLHQVAFPVDTNVGRIAVRLGWVPLQPLPDSVQMHLLDLYPVLATVQQYLWPRLCKLDQKTLYELHYHMITFGKVFCTKTKPNCKACPMKAKCKHYASARHSELLALPEPEEGTSAVTIHERNRNNKPVVVNFRPSLLLTQDNPHQNFIIELPTSPDPPPQEPELEEHDIEDYPWDNNEIPTIMLKKEAEASKELVVLSSQAASRPIRKLKDKQHKRTQHIVYELPDDHPVLERFERRDPDDKFPYLLAIWTPGETANSSNPPKQRCRLRERNAFCQDRTCFPCNNFREEQAQIVRGTILIPCRTAMRGSFPLNGTYFQVNEVFADHGTSIDPIKVPRHLIWNLERRIAYFGSSVTVTFGELSVQEIQYGFWRGYVCVRGFDRRTRKPKALMKRLHCLPGTVNEADY